VPGTRPFWQPPGFPVGIGKPLHDLSVQFPVHHIKKGVDCSEGIPETIVREHIARQYPAVVGAVMNDFIMLINLVEFPGKQKDPVEARVESPDTVRVVILYPDPAQFLLPGIFCLAPGFFKGVLSNFPVQIQQGLFRTDK